eukprot:5870178-Prymnesium_polylepis.1
MPIHTPPYPRHSSNEYWRRERYLRPLYAANPVTTVSTRHTNQQSVTVWSRCGVQEPRGMSSRVGAAASRPCYCALMRSRENEREQPEDDCKEDDRDDRRAQLRELRLGAHRPLERLQRAAAHVGVKEGRVERRVEALERARRRDRGRVVGVACDGVAAQKADDRRGGDLGLLQMRHVAARLHPAEGRRGQRAPEERHVLGGGQHAVLPPPQQQDVDRRETRHEGGDRVA